MMPLGKVVEHRIARPLRTSTPHAQGPSRLQVRTLCEAMGESLEVHEYERFTPLKVQRGLGGRYRNVRPGDCIVAFSRKDIFTIKQVGWCTPNSTQQIAAARRCLT